MSILNEVLLEEYEREQRVKKAYWKEYSQLPKGYVVYKKINNNKYPYLQWRNGNRVLSKYIKKEDIEKMLQNQSRKRKLHESIKRVDKDIQKLGKVLNRV